MPDLFLSPLICLFSPAGPGVQQAHKELQRRRFLSETSSKAALPRKTTKSQEARLRQQQASADEMYRALLLF